ncbi:hypothetical protein GEMRC1_003660 [Eukaryota sp. GEM-RC1]
MDSLMMNYIHVYLCLPFKSITGSTDGVELFFAALESQNFELSGIIGIGLGIDPRTFSGEISRISRIKIDDIRKFEIFKLTENYSAAVNSLLRFYNCLIHSDNNHFDSDLFSVSEAIDFASNHNLLHEFLKIKNPLILSQIFDKYLTQHSSSIDLSISCCAFGFSRKAFDLFLSRNDWQSVVMTTVGQLSRDDYDLICSKLDPSEKIKFLIEFNTPVEVLSMACNEALSSGQFELSYRFSKYLGDEAKSSEILKMLFDDVSKSKFSFDLDSLSSLLKRLARIDTFIVEEKHLEFEKSKRKRKKFILKNDF